MQQSFQLVDYEHLYRSTEQRNRDGHRPLISNNFGNLTTIRAIEHLVLHHPLFGKFSNLICFHSLLLKSLNPHINFQYQIHNATFFQD